jgi:hypothetical protein
VHAIHTGEDQPFVFGDQAESVIHALIGSRRTNLDEWDFQDLGALGAKEFGE